ncbi:methyltransferase domain-containing protein [Flavilitoribacter nigricans]|nr:methyltransferase domain-containing protein [Flavilitoribacter nigricans]
MKQFTPTDIENYYDHTEVHYRMWWNLEEAAGLHYGIWEPDTRTNTEAILNTNARLMRLGGITAADRVLDAGCGIGGSALFLAEQLGCRVEGITLSRRQVETATRLAAEKELDELVSFSRQNYLDTDFPDAHFDVVWAIESFGSAPAKADFFREMYRILKPGGRILFADTFKPYPYDITTDKDMLTMLNGWAISDILALEELEAMSREQGFPHFRVEDVSAQIKPSVNRIYRAALFGMIGTKAYNLFKTATYFSRIHYKTGLAQKKTYRRGKWGYYLVSCTKANGQ